MPLLIKGERVLTAPTSVKQFHQKYSSFKASSRQLTQQEVTEVGPVGLLYVGQREYGGTSPEDDVIKIIGSEDATTCHISVLRHTGSGATCVLHFDGCETQQGLNDMIQLVSELSENKPAGRLEMHLAGGFEDERKNSEEVSLDLFGCLVKCQAEIHLVTACIGEHNTVYKNRIPFPIIYGIAVEVETGRIFKATFPDKGPDLPLRSARHFTGGRNNLRVYNWRQKQMAIGPFTYEPLNDIDNWLTMPDHCYRKYMSTSPAQEPESFESSIRACLQHMKDHPEPMKTLFQGDTPRCYKKLPNGKWERV
ncbi:protein N-terminal asparagine amidohydrolase-like [Littorina saxatilis]|uniref:Protein N-terminal asparagine amidohydrolase n=1 Tax=Littorina saxatilis TaxID=31220 RepID=A0AAN9BTS7_9CAEN